MKRGYCNRLEVLEASALGNKALYDALADGVCHKLHTLDLISDRLGPLADAMRSRMMDKGCCGLKALVLRHDRGGISDLSSLLSSGACEALEELRAEDLHELGRQAMKGIAGWLSRTKASHLQTLIINDCSTTLTTSLCSPGVALSLHRLTLSMEDAESISLLSQTIGGGKWPQLKVS